MDARANRHGDGVVRGVQAMLAVRSGVRTGTGAPGYRGDIASTVSPKVAIGRCFERTWEALGNTRSAFLGLCIKKLKIVCEKNI